MGRGTVRALLAACIAMAVLIVVAVGVMAALLARRATAPQPAGASAGAVRLAEPDGTQIAGASGPPEAVVLLLRGGGPDRVVVVDSRAGRVLGRVGVGP